MVAASKRMHDEPESSLERAIFWTEYVVRHGGAPNLRSPGSTISWAEFFLLDVLAAVIALVWAAVYILKRLLRLLVLQCGPIKVKTN